MDVLVLIGATLILIAYFAYEAFTAEVPDHLKPNDRETDGPYGRRLV